MEFAVAFPSRVNDHGLVKLAEDLGYAQAWFYDSQMVYSDVYATMALAADRTSKIKLGTGVAVVTTRMAPVIAHSIATINELAPGRVELGISVGNTARLTMGLPPAKFSRMRDDIRVIRRLLRGEAAEFTTEGVTNKIRFLHPNMGFVNLEAPIPVTLSAFQPKGVEFCGSECDGHMVWGLIPNLVQMFRAAVGEAATKAGRKPQDVPMKGIYPTAVLRPGETAVSPRIMNSVESFITNALHFLTEWGNAPIAIPPEAQETVAAYAEYVRGLPGEDRHLILHTGHLLFARDDEKRFLTRELAEAAAVIAEPDDLVTRIRALESAGLSQYAIQVTDDPEAQLRDFAAAVIDRY